MNNPKDPKIANRESWLKVFVVGGFSALIAWKILSAPIAFNLSDFRFTDLLNLLMAVFAIALSVAFYFKATETSNQFYDNTYKFMKDFSEILGRVEAGFGERLKHLDEGYERLGERFDKIPFDSKKAEQEIKEEEKHLKKKEEERNQLLENLAERAKLQEAEKRTLFEQLKKKDDELLNAKRELNFLRHRLEDSKTDETPTDQLPGEFIQYFFSFVVNRMDRFAIRQAPLSFMQKEFENIRRHLPGSFIIDCKKFGLIGDDGLLTKRGFELIRRLAIRE